MTNAGMDTVEGSKLKVFIIIKQTTDEITANVKCVSQQPLSGVTVDA